VPAIVAGLIRQADLVAMISDFCEALDQPWPNINFNFQTPETVAA
jgi:hypothetical protein